MGYCFVETSIRRPCINLQHNFFQCLWAMSQSACTTCQIETTSPAAALEASLWMFSCVLPYADELQLIILSFIMTCSDRWSPMKVNFPNCGKKHRFCVIFCHGRRLSEHRKFERHILRFEKKGPTKILPSRELTYPTLGKGKSSSKCHFWEICWFPGGYQSFLTKNVPTIHINQRHLRLETSCRFEFHHLGTSKNSVMILGRGGQRLTTLVD